MLYSLHKKRITAEYHQLKKAFSVEGDFYQSLSLLNPLQILVNWQELNLESASITYCCQVNHSEVNIEINYMRSSSKTSRCYDVYVRVYPNTESKINDEVHKFLCQLHEHFNRGWIVTDADLCLSLLK